MLLFEFPHRVSQPAEACSPLMGWHACVSGLFVFGVRCRSWANLVEYIPQSHQLSCEGLLSRSYLLTLNESIYQNKQRDRLSNAMICHGLQIYYLMPLKHKLKNRNKQEIKLEGFNCWKRHTVQKHINI